MEKLKEFFNTKDKGKFWLHIVIVAFIVWGITGVISIFKPTGTLLIINEIVGGVAPCVILAAAILSILERKSKRGQVSMRQNTSETVILFVFFCLVIFAQVVAVLTDTVSYGVPVTLAGIAVELCVWTAGPGITNHVKLDMKETMKILCCGTIASVILGKFISYLATTLR